MASRPRQCAGQSAGKSRLSFAQKRQITGLRGIGGGSMNAPSATAVRMPLGSSCAPTKMRLSPWSLTGRFVLIGRPSRAISLPVIS